MFVASTTFSRGGISFAAWLAASFPCNSFSLTFKTADTQSVTVTDTVSTTITGTQPGISVAPAAPTNLTASVISSSQINLNWTSSSGATGYLVQQSLNGSTGWAQVGSPSGSTTFQQKGLSAGTTYYYRVLATPGTIDSAYSNVASATTTGTAIPRPGTGFASRCVTPAMHVIATKPRIQR